MKAVIKVSELNLDPVSSRPQQNSNVVGKDFRSLLTNSRENSEITVETTRMIIDEASSQVTRRLIEIKYSLHFQIQNAITTVIAEKVHPSIQNTLDTQVRNNFTVVDQGSIEPHMGSRAANFTMMDPGSDGLQESPSTNNFTMVDRRSSELQRKPEAENSQKNGKIVPKRVLHRKMVDRCLERVQWTHM